MSVAYEIITRLRGAGITTYDEPPSSEKDGRYALVVDGPGTAQPHRLATTSHWTDVSVSIMGVSRTKDGCREMLSTIRGALTGVRIPAGGRPLFEESSGPFLQDGSPGDKYWSATINYKAHVLTTGALE